ncbi:hypothetical protein T08_1456 [Trichinella sp. T8]|nr:hypothetical protein T08_1456 [Trichinella sp. T8]
MQVIRHTYLGDVVFLPTRTYSGPAKSMPTCEKAGASTTRSLGNVAILDPVMLSERPVFAPHQHAVVAGDNGESIL